MEDNYLQATTWRPNRLWIQLLGTANRTLSVTLLNFQLLAEKIAAVA